MSQQILIPNNQALYPTPNQHVNFNFSNSIEEYRTSRYLNNILKMFSPDKVLWGLDLRNHYWSGNNLLIEINNGRLIQDSTLINPMFTSLSTVFQLSNISTASKNNSNYVVVIFTEFNYTPVTTQPTSTSPQQFNMKIGIVNKSNNLIYNGDPLTASQYTWNTTKNRLVIYSANITSVENSISEVNINGNIYLYRSHRKNQYTFNYDSVGCFSFDGGIL